MFLLLLQAQYESSAGEFKLESSHWEELRILKEMLEPFKEATLKLEASKTPTAHIAGRVMLWLLYKAPGLADRPGLVSTNVCSINICSS